MPCEPIRARESPRETVRARKGQKEPMITITRESQREPERVRGTQKAPEIEPEWSQREPGRGRDYKPLVKRKRLWQISLAHFLAHPGFLWLALCLSLALTGSLWLLLTLFATLYSSSVWRTLALSGSLLLWTSLIQSLLGSQRRCHADAHSSVCFSQMRHHSEIFIQIQCTLAEDGSIAYYSMRVAWHLFLRANFEG